MFGRWHSLAPAHRTLSGDRSLAQSGTGSTYAERCSVVGTVWHRLNVRWTVFGPWHSLSPAQRTLSGVRSLAQSGTGSSYAERCSIVGTVWHRLNVRWAVFDRWHSLAPAQRTLSGVRSLAQSGSGSTYAERCSIVGTVWLRLYQGFISANFMEMFRHSTLIQFRTNFYPFKPHWFILMCGSYVGRNLKFKSRLIWLC